MDLRIHCWNPVRQLAVHRGLLLLLGKHVDALGLLHRRDATAHPRRAAGELVVRGGHGPVERVLERHHAVYGSHALVLQIRLHRVLGARAVEHGARAVGVHRRPRGRELCVFGAVKIIGVLQKHTLKVSTKKVYIYIHPF